MDKFMSFDEIMGMVIKACNNHKAWLPDNGDAILKATTQIYIAQMKIMRNEENEKETIY